MSEKSLNRQIAELCGWKVQRRGEAWVFVSVNTSCALNPKYNTVEEDEAWAIAEGNLLIPDYEHSVDAVLAELPDDCHLQILYEAEGLYWAEIWQDGMERPGWCMDGATRADAAADALRVYAEWKQAQA